MVPERCPHCNRSLEHYDRAGARKHILACPRRTNQYICTGNPRGRPKDRDMIRKLTALEDEWSRDHGPLHGSASGPAEESIAEQI